MKLAAVIFSPSLACVILLAGAGSAEACRFNVRDVGFVDHGEPHYTLCLLTDATTPAGVVDTIRQVSYAVLLDSNVELEGVRIDKQEDHPAVGAMAGLGVRSLPALVMLSPQGEACELPLTIDDKDVRGSAWRCLERAVTSPQRDELAQALATSYCVVLWVASTDEARNQRAKKEITAAVDDIAGMMGQLPKPIRGEPRAVCMGVEDRDNNAVLLWSLGIEASKAAGGPWAFVIYGKGRWIGPTFVGDEITRNGLVGAMGLVGESCECDLDRRQMLGVRLPMRWDDRARQASVRNLGFDPENPMVRLEIRKIMALGASVRDNRTSDPLDGLMGYSEQIITADGPSGFVGRDGAGRAAPRDREQERTAPEAPGVTNAPRVADSPSNEPDTLREQSTASAASTATPVSASAQHVIPEKPLTGLEPPKSSFLATYAVIGAVGVIIVVGSIAIVVKAQRRYA